MAARFDRRQCGRPASRSSRGIDPKKAILALLAGLIGQPTVAQTAETGDRGAVVAQRPAAPGSYHLAYKFQAKQDVRFLLEVDSAIKIQKGQVISNTKNQSVTDRHFHVVSVEADGSAQLELFIDRVKLSYSFDDNPPVLYDTGGADLPPPGFERVKESVGKPLARVRVTRQGQLVSLAGPNQLPSDDPSQNFLVILPDNPVRVGDQWSDDIKVKVEVTRNLDQKVTLRRRYVLESVTGRLATIRMSTAEVTPISDARIRAQMLQLTPEGTIVFDLDKGMITDRVMHCARVETDVMGPGSLMAARLNLKGTLK